jgi:DNA-binding response OmpR family regulator
MRLREKLGNYAQLIQNVRGKGYRYEPLEETS